VSRFSKKQSDTPKRWSNERVKKPSPKPNLFKRNRTLTGTTSNHLKSANTTSNLESPRAHVHKLSILRRKVVGVLIVILISAVPIWILISNFTATVKVDIVDVASVKPTDALKYEKAIQNYLDVNPISRLSFFLDQSAMTEYISAKLPEILTITQEKTQSIGKANFEIKMRTPIAGWTINNKQYYVDSKGIPFERNYFMAPSVSIIDNSGISPKVGTVAIASNRFLSFVGQVVSQAKTSGYTVTQATLPANTTRELEIRLAEGNYLVKLSIDRPVGEQIEDMVAAVKFFSSRRQTPQYIDVRVSGKAFYKP
jgi:cell division septal protein FtsQ